MKRRKTPNTGGSVSRIGEFGLIERILRKFPARGRSPILVGPGDDAAVIGCRKGAPFILTTDMLVEGTHFRLEWSCPEAVGFKSVTANLSDIAAMGGVPVGIVVSLGIPASLPTRAVDLLYSGISEALSCFGGGLLGGDTVRSDRITVSVAAVGNVAGRAPLLRSGARPGDLVCVTGMLGRPELGLLLLKKYVGRRSGRRSSDLRAWAGRRVSYFKRQIPPRIRREGYDCVLTHLMPSPRMGEAQLLSRQLDCAPSAMMDVSDGLSSDLNQLAHASRVNIEVYQDRIPIHPSVVKTTRHLGLSAVKAAISSGEEYELLFTVPPDRFKRLLKLLTDLKAAPVTVIGQVTSSRRSQGRSRSERPRRSERPGRSERPRRSARRGTVTLVGPSSRRSVLTHRGFKHF